MSEQLLAYPIGGLKVRVKALDPHKTMSKESVALIVDAITLSNRKQWVLPGVFQGEESGIRIEWTSKTTHVALEVEEDGTVWLFRMELKGNFTGYFMTSDPAEALKKLEEYMP